MDKILKYNFLIMSQNHQKPLNSVGFELLMSRYIFNNDVSVYRYIYMKLQWLLIRQHWYNFAKIRIQQTHSYNIIPLHISRALYYVCCTSLVKFRSAFPIRLIVQRDIQFKTIWRIFQKHKHRIIFVKTHNEPMLQTDTFVSWLTTLCQKDNMNC
jgi:hypothetical protein